MLFSVIVANYNNACYLPVLASSMFAQTYTNWELIIVDDSSTDNSIEVIRNIAIKDKRVKYYIHENNLGAGAAFRTAAEHATGTLIGMLGADDALTKNALERIVAEHKLHPGMSLITSMAFDCNETLSPIGLCKLSGKQPEGVALIREAHISNFVTFKRESYMQTTGFDPALRGAVDYDIYLKLEEVGMIGFVSEPLYLYRRHDRGISQGSSGVKAAYFGLIARLNTYERRRLKGFHPNLSRLEYINLAKVYNERTAQQCISNKNYKKALHVNFKTLSLIPWYLFTRNFFSIFYRSIRGLVTQ